MFSSAQQPSYPANGFDTLVLPNIPTLAQVCQQAVKLPCSPVLLPRLISAINSDRATLTELEGVIRLDSAMAADALRVANSAAYGNSAPVDSISEALMRLGLDEIFRLASLTTLRRWEQFHEGALPWTGDAFSRYSFAFAKGAEFLAKKLTAEVDPMVAYSAGLVANIGKLATGYVCAPFFTQIRALAEERPWTEAERAVLGFTSDDVGLALLKSWRFSPLLTSALKYRRDPTLAPVEELTFMAVLHAGEAVARTVAPDAAVGFGADAPRMDFLNQHGLTEQVLKLAAAEVKKSEGRCFPNR